MSKATISIVEALEYIIISPDDLLYYILKEQEQGEEEMGSFHKCISLEIARDNEGVKR